LFVKAYVLSVTWSDGTTTTTDVQQSALVDFRVSVVSAKLWCVYLTDESTAGHAGHAYASVLLESNSTVAYT
jgi:hypothetical protein